MVNDKDKARVDAMVLHFVVPGALDTRTGGYGYDRRIIAALRLAGWQVLVHELTGAYPWPDAAARQRAAACLAAIADGARVVIDGLAFGVLAEVVAPHAQRLELTALVHHPLALETGLSHDQVALLTDAERRALQFARRVIVTSAPTCSNLAAFGVAPYRCRVVRPGTDAVTPASGSDDGTVQLLCVASVTARKGHELLLQALQHIDAMPWRLTCVGSTGRDPDTAARVRALIEQAGWQSRVVLTGELDDAALDAQYQGADIFVLASFHEGYGMVFDEALARGLPIVATEVGALETAVSPGARLMVPAGDAQALSTALAAVIGDAGQRRAMQQAALVHALSRRNWRAAGLEFAAALTDPMA